MAASKKDKTIAAIRAVREELASLDESATPGPWRVLVDGSVGIVRFADGTEWRVTCGHGPINARNLELIARARSMAATAPAVLQQALDELAADREKDGADKAEKRPAKRED